MLYVLWFGDIHIGYVILPRKPSIKPLIGNFVNVRFIWDQPSIKLIY